mmetsp:Transcript_86033/g.200041  ORF Transcript_86033/g.200041 Transcript_86033/m.200041 type:complete len:158 (-) Transcript_86033:42-515(-)
MSSWQQAISEDVRKGKKRGCPVVMNRNQEKNIKTGREDPDNERWTCEDCGHEMLDCYYRCEKCQCLKPEERAFRLEMRAKGGEIGRGGGYFQRSAVEDRREWNSDNEEYDEFGRKKKKGKVVAVRAEKGEPSERQRAALARLHQKGRGTRASRSHSH